MSKKKANERRPVFATKFDPRIPALQPIIAKHWRSMIGQDKHLKECFEQPPLTAFRRQTNLRDLLIKSKVPPPTKPYPQRNIRGMTRCAKSCTACPYILETKEKMVQYVQMCLEKKQYSSHQDMFHIFYKLL